MPLRNNRQNDDEVLGSNLPTATHFRIRSLSRTDITLTLLLRGSLSNFKTFKNVKTQECFYSYHLALQSADLCIWHILPPTPNPTWRAHPIPVSWTPTCLVLDSISRCHRRTNTDSLITLITGLLLLSQLKSWTPSTPWCCRANAPAWSRVCVCMHVRECVGVPIPSSVICYRQTYIDIDKEKNIREPGRGC